MVIFFGPPGSGKSVQGQILAARHGWRWLSTGQLLRQTSNVEVIAEMRKGKLISDDLVNRVFEDALHRAKGMAHIIIDGYPRHVDQAKWLLGQMPKHDRKVSAVIVLDVDDDEILRRLELRGRLDDAPEIVRTRLQDYRVQTQPVIEYFAKYGVHVEQIDGMGSVGTVHDRVEEVVEECSLA
jgi:adenylate kinase